MASMEFHLPNQMSGFKTDAKTHLANMKLVTNVTCAETVILCHPVLSRFIQLGACGIMPATPISYLRVNRNWKIKREPSR